MVANTRTNFEERPLQLLEVEVSRDGDVVPVLNQATLGVLQRFPTPLKVLAITGKAREGKSTMLNLILRKLGVTVDASKLFLSSAGYTTVTSGVWIWGCPLTLPDGSHLLLVDTEGTERGNDQVTALVTAFACFFSSLLVFHIRGSFSNTDMDQLSRMQCIVSECQSEKAAEVFPALMMVARDLSWGWLKTEGLATDQEQRAPLESLKNFLTNPETHKRFNDHLEKVQLANQPYQQERNKVRDILKTWFARREFHPLLPFSSDDDEPALNELRILKETRFGTAYDALLDRLLSACPPKKFQNLENFSMPALVETLKRLVENLEDGEFAIQSTLFYLHQQQAMIIAQSAVEAGLAASAPQLKLHESDPLAIAKVFADVLAMAMEQFNREANAKRLLPGSLGLAEEEIQRSLKFRELQAEARARDYQRAELQKNIDDLQRQAQKNGEMAESYLAEKQRLQEQMKKSQEQYAATQAQLQELERLRQQNEQLARDLRHQKRRKNKCAVM